MTASAASGSDPNPIPPTTLKQVKYDPFNDPKLETKQKTLSLLTHAANCKILPQKCANKQCKVSKAMLQHIVSCKEVQCKAPFCAFSKFVLRHGPQIKQAGEELAAKRKNIVVGGETQKTDPKRYRHVYARKRLRPTLRTPTTEKGGFQSVCNALNQEGRPLSRKKRAKLKRKSLPVLHESKKEELYSNNADADEESSSGSEWSTSSEEGLQKSESSSSEESSDSSSSDSGEDETIEKDVFRQDSFFKTVQKERQRLRRGSMTNKGEHHAPSSSLAPFSPQQKRMPPRSPLRDTAILRDRGPRIPSRNNSDDTRGRENGENVFIRKDEKGNMKSSVRTGRGGPPIIATAHSGSGGEIDDSDSDDSSVEGEEESCVMKREKGLLVDTVAAIQVASSEALSYDKRLSSAKGRGVKPEASKDSPTSHASTEEKKFAKVTEESPKKVSPKARDAGINKPFSGDSLSSHDFSNKERRTKEATEHPSETSSSASSASSSSSSSSSSSLREDEKQHPTVKLRTDVSARTTKDKGRTPATTHPKSLDVGLKDVGWHSLTVRPTSTSAALSAAFLPMDNNLDEQRRRLQAYASKTTDVAEMKDRFEQKIWVPPDMAGLLAGNSQTLNSVDTTVTNNPATDVGADPKGADWISFKPRNGSDENKRSAIPRAGESSSKAAPIWTLPQETDLASLVTDFRDTSTVVDVSTSLTANTTAKPIPKLVAPEETCVSTLAVLVDSSDSDSESSLESVAQNAMEDAKMANLEENKALVQNEADLRATISSLESHLKEAREHIVSLTKAKEAQDEALNLVSKERDKYKGAAETTQNQLAKTSDAVSSLSKHVSDIELANKLALDEKRVLSQENTGLKKALSALNQRFEDASSRVLSLQRLNESYLKDLKSAQNELDDALTRKLETEPSDNIASHPYRPEVSTKLESPAGEPCEKPFAIGKLGPKTAQMPSLDITETRDIMSSDEEAKRPHPQPSVSSAARSSKKKHFLNDSDSDSSENSTDMIVKTQQSKPAAPPKKKSFLDDSDSDSVSSTGSSTGSMNKTNTAGKDAEKEIESTNKATIPDTPAKKEEESAIKQGIEEAKSEMEASQEEQPKEPINDILAKWRAMQSAGLLAAKDDAKDDTKCNDKEDQQANDARPKERKWKASTYVPLSYPVPAKKDKPAERTWKSSTYASPSYSTPANRQKEQTTNNKVESAKLAWPWGNAGNAAPSERQTEETKRGSERQKGESGSEKLSSARNAWDRGKASSTAVSITAPYNRWKSPSSTAQGTKASSTASTTPANKQIPAWKAKLQANQCQVSDANSGKSATQTVTRHSAFAHSPGRAVNAATSLTTEVTRGLTFPRTVPKSEEITLVVEAIPNEGNTVEPNGLDWWKMPASDDWWSGGDPDYLEKLVIEALGLDG
jgi:TAZ zinc finger